MVAAVVAFLVGADVDGGSDEDVVGGVLGDDDAFGIGLGLGDRPLSRVVFEAAAERRLHVLGGEFQHEHQLEVEDVRLALAGVPLALFQGEVDLVVLAAEAGVDLLAAPGARYAAGQGCRVFREQQAWAFGAVRQEQSRHRFEAVVLLVAVKQFDVVVVSVDAEISGRDHDEHVSVGSVAAESAVPFDGGDVRHAGVVHGGVHIAPLEGVEVGVVVASGVRGGGYRHGQVCVVVGLRACGHMGEGVARELHAVDSAGAVLTVELLDIRVFVLRFVVMEGRAVHVGLAQGAHDLREIAQADELVRICHFLSFLSCGWRPTPSRCRTGRCQPTDCRWWLV